MDICSINVDWEPKAATEPPFSDGGAPLPDALAQVTFAPPLE